jgi:hypothetical protein
MRPSAPAAAPRATASAPTNWGLDLLNLGAKPGPVAAPADPDEQGVKKFWQAVMKREPNADELAKGVAQLKQLRAEGKNEMGIVWIMAAELKKSEEYRTTRLDELINDVMQANVNRNATPEEIAKLKPALEKAIKEEGADGQKVEDIITYCVKIGDEYKQLHAPKINTNRDEFYLKQPNDWSCGPTSLTMAMAALGLRPSNGETVNEMTHAVGATPAAGVPGNASLISNAAQKLGAQARFDGDGSPGNVRRALQEGHGVVLNGALGATGGHFMYVAGIAEDGRFIIADPWRPTITRMNDAELDAFANRGQNPRGFAEIWK